MRPPSISLVEERLTDCGSRRLEQVRDALTPCKAGPSPRRTPYLPMQLGDFTLRLITTSKAGHFKGRKPTYTQNRREQHQTLLEGQSVWTQGRR